MTASAVRKYFIGVVSLQHAKKGYEGGFTQACHGKRAPLAKMSKGDWFVQYSPKMALGSKCPCQKFSFIGRATTGRVYQFEMAPGFIPHRMDITYMDTDQAPYADIKPLLDDLSFIKNKKRWGFPFMRGFLEVPQEDFAVIYHAMTGKEFDPEQKLTAIKTERVAGMGCQKSQGRKSSGRIQDCYMQIMQPKKRSKGKKKPKTIE